MRCRWMYHLAVVVVCVTRLNPVDGVRGPQGTGLLSSLARRRFRLIHDPLSVVHAIRRKLPIEEFQLGDISG